MHAIAPDGRDWIIRLRWTHRPRWRAKRKASRKTDRGSDLLDLFTPDDDWLFAITLIAVIVVLILYGGPLLALLFDLIWAVIALIGGLVARLLFRRPWLIEAIGPRGERHTYDVVGFRASRRAVNDLAEAIQRSGQAPEGLSG